MIVDALLDTNVLVYAASKIPADAEKQKISRELIARTKLGTSAQVLQEFYVTATKKMQDPLSHHVALDWIEEMEQFPCVPIDASLVYQGAENARRYQISYWDGAIIAATARLGAPVLYTEDLNHGQQYGSVTAINPFRNE